MKDDLMPKDDLNAFRGILIAILLSLPIWAALVALLYLFGFLG
jgi:hypothetical protein